MEAVTAEAGAASAIVIVPPTRSDNVILLDWPVIVYAPAPVAFVNSKSLTISEPVPVVQAKFASPSKEPALLN